MKTRAGLVAVLLTSVVAMADDTLTTITCRDGRKLQASVSSQTEIKELCSRPTDPDSAAFVYHWEVDGTIAGYEYAEHANVNKQVDVHLLDEVIRLPDGSAPLQLLHDYNIRLVDSPAGEWTRSKRPVCCRP